MEEISNVKELIELFEKNNIWIFGAGKVAFAVVKFLKKSGKMPKGVFVSNKNYNVQSILGIPVNTLDSQCSKDDVLLVCVKNGFITELKDALPKLWGGKIVFLLPELYLSILQEETDYDLDNNMILKDAINLIHHQRDSLLRLDPKPCFEYMVVNICDHCNLRCKGCDHFACIADEYFVDVDIIKKDIERMGELFSHDYIMKIAVMGGEPLLHPHLLEILRIVREQFPYTQLRLTTNGILLAKQEKDFWDTCRKANVTIVNTKYPINIKHDSLRKKAEEENVKFMHYEGTGGTSVRKLQKHTIDVKGMNNPAKSFADCHISNYGNFLMEGKLYRCPFSCQAYRIFEKKFNVGLRITDKDYIDIYKADNMQEILEFGAKPGYFCRYCSGRTEDFDWERSKKEITEWI